MGGTEMSDDLVDPRANWKFAARRIDQLNDRIGALTARAEAAESERDALTAENNRLRDSLRNIVDSYEATSELHTSHAGCAANLYDHARFALRGEQK